MSDTETTAFKTDQAVLKQKEVEYCVEGYHSFKSVEHRAFVSLLQSCVDFGAKYGKFDISQALYMRKTVSREAAALASNVKMRLTARLKDAADDGAVSLPALVRCCTGRSSPMTILSCRRSHVGCCPCQPAQRSQNVTFRQWDTP